MAWDNDLLPPENAASQHWAFQPVVRPPVPVVQTVGWMRNPVDAFIAAGHITAKLNPAPEADRRTLLRRLTIDLTGLPPSPEEMGAFLADKSGDAYEKQVERLLASPRYGERWGRHWLDVVRYADSEGYESDHLRPYAWRYRDYVIASFNADKPFDRFLREQIAGDELTPYRDENLIATGFLAAARLSSNEEDKARQFNDHYVDVANATAAAFLGLTFNCAQCHSHKFDPISHADYYRFQGYFRTGLSGNFALRDPVGVKTYESAKPAEYDPARQLVHLLFETARAKLDATTEAALPAEQRAARAVPADRRSPTEHRLAIEAELRYQYTAAQVERAIPDADKPLYAELKKKVATIEAKLPDPPQTWGFYSPVTSPHRVEVLPMKGFYPPRFDPVELARSKPFVLKAGDARDRGPAVDIGWPAVFGPTSPTGRTRTGLADWFTDPKHPLTDRVWANRVWQFHFGRGLVTTPNDFGVRGAKPSHPELLDWLAAELVSAKWNTKHLHRLIVTSATYRQSSQVRSAEFGARNSAELAGVVGTAGISIPNSALRTPQLPDPENRWLARWAPRRVESEAVRDFLLEVCGEHDAKIGGPPDTDETKSRRRAVYLLQKRQRSPGAQALFDAPTGATESCPVRTTTATPLHALYLLNNEFTIGRAKAFASRVRASANDRDQQIELATRIALGRSLTDAERQQVVAFFEKPGSVADPLAEFCHVLVAANEFTTLE